VIRVICRETDINDAAHVGGPVHVTYRTFDVELPEVEAFLREATEWQIRDVVGVEARLAAGPKGGD
jgi:hypothetical protein